MYSYSVMYHGARSTSLFGLYYTLNLTQSIASLNLNKMELIIVYYIFGAKQQRNKN